MKKEVLTQTHGALNECHDVYIYITKLGPERAIFIYVWTIWVVVVQTLAHNTDGALYNLFFFWYMKKEFG